MGVVYIARSAFKVDPTRVGLMEVSFRLVPEIIYSSFAVWFNVAVCSIGEIGAEYL